MKSTPSQLLVLIPIVLTIIIPQPLQPPPSSSSYVILIIIHPHPGCISSHPSSSTTSSTSSWPILGHHYSHDLIASSCSIAFPHSRFSIYLARLLMCSPTCLAQFVLFKRCRRHTRTSASRFHGKICKINVSHQAYMSSQSLIPSYRFLPFFAVIPHPLAAWSAFPHHPLLLSFSVCVLAEVRLFYILLVYTSSGSPRVFSGDRVWISSWRSGARV